MATPAKLREIGKDGFDLIEKHLVTPRKANKIGGLAATAFQGRNTQMEEGIVIISTSGGAAVHYGAFVSLNYPKGKPQNRWAPRSIIP